MLQAARSVVLETLVYSRIKVTKAVHANKARTQDMLWQRLWSQLVMEPQNALCSSNHNDRSVVTFDAHGAHEASQGNRLQVHSVLLALRLNQVRDVPPVVQV